MRVPVGNRAIRSRAGAPAAPAGHPTEAHRAPRSSRSSVSRWSSGDGVLGVDRETACSAREGHVSLVSRVSDSHSLIAGSGQSYLGPVRSLRVRLRRKHGASFGPLVLAAECVGPIRPAAFENRSPNRRRAGHRVRPCDARPARVARFGRFSPLWRESAVRLLTMLVLQGTALVTTRRFANAVQIPARRGNQKMCPAS